MSVDLLVREHKRVTLIAVSDNSVVINQCRVATLAGPRVVQHDLALDAVTDALITIVNPAYVGQRTINCSCVADIFLLLLTLTEHDSFSARYASTVVVHIRRCIKAYTGGARLRVCIIMNGNLYARVRRHHLLALDLRVPQ